LRVSVGFVLRVHGIKGWLRVRSELASLPSEVFVGDHAMKVTAQQREKAELLVQLDGITDRDAAEMMKGAAITVERAQLPPAAPGEVWVSELIGCAVVDTAGRALGTVRAVESTGSQELLVVAGAREWRLPFVEPLVVTVDVAARRVVCDPPEGLVDL
jgi:16S rRNA processing protein RimM